MFANLLFYYNCGHVSHNFALNKTDKTHPQKICPLCFTGTINIVEYDCELCGKPTQTTASGFKCSRRLFCADCRKTYNNWDTLARKAKKERRDFPDWRQYVKDKHAKTPNSKDVVRDPEPPLTPREFMDIGRFGKRESPCAKCANIANDKNEAPCLNCQKLSAYIQTPQKLFLNSLYV